MKVIIVIPARFRSSRFPGKPLVYILGKPMIEWVSQLSAMAVGKENVYIATEDSRIKTVVEKLGFKAVMTSDNCLTGTDRLAEVAQQIDADIYINVQGDEPLVNPVDIIKIIKQKKLYPHEVINGYVEIADDEDPNNINIPKVIFTEDKRLVYMSRYAIPGFKDFKNAPKVYYKQVCIYAFNRQELLNFGALQSKSKLEESEDIEILRFFELGKTIRMVKTHPGSLAVDVPEDVINVEKELSKR